MDAGPEGATKLPPKGASLQTLMKNKNPVQRDGPEGKIPKDMLSQRLLTTVIWQDSSYVVPVCGPSSLIAGRATRFLPLSPMGGKQVVWSLDD